VLALTFNDLGPGIRLCRRTFLPAVGRIGRCSGLIGCRG